jgi:hypothetical protein
LELIVFNDFIKEQQFRFTENKVSEFNKIVNEQDYISKYSANIAENKGEQKRLDSNNQALLTNENRKYAELANFKAKLNKPNTSQYKEALSGIAGLQSQINNLKVNFSYLTDPDEIESKKTQIQSLHNKKVRFEKIRNDEIRKWNAPLNAEINRINTELNAIKNDKELNETKISSLTKQIEISKQKKDTLEQVAEKKTAKFDNTQKKTNNFIEGFRVLEYSVWEKDKKTGELINGTVLFFLFLIRFLFFMIEILPTIVKIVTPIGNYERRVYQEEKNLELHLSSTTYQKYIEDLFHMTHEAKVQLEKDRIQAESDMHQELIDQIKTAQLEVARSRIDNWKEKEIN